LGSSVVYWAGKEAVSRQGGRKNVVENVLLLHKMTRLFVRRLKIDIALDLIRQSANEDYSRMNVVGLLYVSI
jgi:hypothetical protein